MKLSQIKWLHVEPTTRCNAWCPACARNKNGFGLTNFKITDLSVDRLKFVIDSLPALETVQFCGNRGDPCASKILDQQLEVIQNKKLYLQLRTNGNLRSKKWWSNLAKNFSNKLEVWFAIDGLADTHSIYRQGLSWQKTIDNAESFINAGGNAIWQFIPFAHNEHQIKDCMQLATKMNFSKFEFIKNARYSKKSFHYKTGKPIDIKPWSKHSIKWKGKGIKPNPWMNSNLNIKNKKIVAKKNCMHLDLKSIFLNPQGKITPCCYMSNTPLNSVDINSTIETKNFLPDCIETCGSNKVDYKTIL